jgi:hypothetical protein
VGQLFGRGGEAFVEELGLLAFLVAQGEAVVAFRDFLFAVVDRQQDHAAEARHHRQDDLQ